MQIWSSLSGLAGPNAPEVFLTGQSRGQSISLPLTRGNLLLRDGLLTRLPIQLIGHFPQLLTGGHYSHPGLPLIPTSTTLARPSRLVPLVERRPSRMRGSRLTSLPLPAVGSLPAILLVLLAIRRTLLPFILVVLISTGIPFIFIGLLLLVLLFPISFALVAFLL